MNTRSKQTSFPVDKLNPVWVFANIDRDGKFAFDPSRLDFDAEQFVVKLLEYSTMTWFEIKKQTHDDGKSKHHQLSPQSLSLEAWQRIRAKHFEEEKIEHLFSFALNNKIRIIGFREIDTPEFKVVWYDANHEFAPSKLKHT